MGLFHRNENEANFAGGSKNVMESIQRQNDTGTLIYLDPRQDFNTNSVITVAPNEQVIFIKGGEFYGTLPSGRHEVKTENYAVLSKIRNMLTGGISTFTCQVYHVQTNEQIIPWGTSSPIEVQDYFLGNGVIGVKTPVRGNADFRVRFNFNEDDDASKKAFMRIMGDKSTFTVTDLSLFFQAQISQKVATGIAKQLKDISKTESINGISEHTEELANMLLPYFSDVFLSYGLELINFSFNSLAIEETEERQKYMDRLIAAAHTGSYDKAMQQELLENVSLNPGAGGIAAAGAGLGMGMATGNAFAQMATTAFGNPQPQQPPQPQGFGGQGRFGTGGTPQQQQTAQPDPMESLSKMKQLLDAGLIKQEQYDAKVAEIMSRL